MSGQIDDIRFMLYKHGVAHVNDMSDEHVIEIFNDELADKPYWFCKDCHEFHSKSQHHCSMPCVGTSETDAHVGTELVIHNTDKLLVKSRTEEEYERIYSEFDPTSYEQDDDHLQFPHTRFASWMNTSQRFYNMKILRHASGKLEEAARLWKCRNGKVNINDMSKPMTRFEQALRKFEIKRFNGWRQTGASKSLEELLNWALQTAPQ